MNTYKHIYIFLVSSLIWSVLTSQEYKSIPEEFGASCTIQFVNQINNGEVNLEDLNYGFTTNNWVVYSDRSTNFLYNTYNGNTTGRMLEYMQPLYVKRVKGKWLFVYSQDHEEMGWVRSDNILMNSFCLLTTYYTDGGLTKSNDNVGVSIPMKKIIITSISELVDNGINIEDAEKNRNFYTEPSTNIAKKCNSVQDFEIYYVYKEQGGSVLLASNDFLNQGPTANKSLIKGWIPRGNTTTWDNRLMLEPSRSQEAEIIYGNTILHGYKELKQLQNDLNENIQIDSTSFIDFQVGPIVFDRMRKPVIMSNVSDNKDIKQVVSICRDTEGDVINKDRLKEMERKIESQQLNTNIIFVVDATSSMRPYFKSVANSIEGIMKENREKHQHNLKFAVIIYRDYADLERAYAVLPLTADQSLVKSYLNSVDCSSKNKLMPEAQFNGIIKGFNELNLNPEESNLMVLIGDCGNHIDSKSSINYDTDDVADVLDKYNLNVISFQVNLLPHPSGTYFKFNNDVKEFIQLKAEKLINSSDTDLSADWSRVEGKRNSLELSMVENSDDFVNTFGRIIYANNGMMQTDVLKEHITKRLSEYMKVTTNNLIILRKGWNPKVDKIPEGLLLYIMNSFEITRDEALEFLQRNEVTQSAYVSLKYNNSQINALEHVVFMTRKDYKSLKNTLNEFTFDADAVSHTVRAMKFQEGLINVCEEILGGSTGGTSNKSSKSNTVIENLKINDVWQVMFGVDYEGFSEIKNEKLNELASFKPKKILKDVIDDFVSKSKLFCNEGYNSGDEYEKRRMSIDGNYFYWVPLEDLPGTTKID